MGSADFRKASFHISACSWLPIDPISVRALPCFKQKLGPEPIPSQASCPCGQWQDNCRMDLSGGLHIGWNVQPSLGSFCCE